MTISQGQQEDTWLVDDTNGWWDAEIDVRTPSPRAPAKRMRMTLEDIRDEMRETTIQEDSVQGNLLRLDQTPEALGYGSGDSFQELWYTPDDSLQSISEYPGFIEDSSAMFAERSLTAPKRKKMQTGCIPCLYVGRRCRGFRMRADLLQSERYTV